MERDKLNKIAKGFFEKNKDLKALFATESGHFFYDRADCSSFMSKSPKAEKMVIYPNAFEEGEEAPKEFSFEDCPGGEILKMQEFKSVAEIKAVADLTKIHGIGNAKAKEIKEYLKNFD